MTTALSPRERLLETASRLFYAEGIHTVPVDKLVTEANVTRATFYRHFPTKEDLVVAYVKIRSDEVKNGFDTAVESAPADQRIPAVLDFVGDFACGAGFRGCPFINASAEFPDPAHPVRVAVSEHRAWFRGALRELAVDVGHPDPDHATSVLVMLHDGALQGGELDDPEAVRATLRRAGGEFLRT
jgi:AcrR family transcriptional regulator